MVVAVASVATDRSISRTFYEAMVRSCRNLFDSKTCEPSHLDWFFDKVASLSLSTLAAIVVAKCVEAVVDG